MSEKWDKFYSVYMFDNITYHKLCKQYPKANRDELKAKCYVLDDNGARIHLGDEKHIYRIQTLHNVQELLATYSMNLRRRINNYWDHNVSGSVKTRYFHFYYERYDKGTYEYGKPNVKTVKTSQLSLFDTPKASNVFEIKVPHEIYQVELHNTWKMPIKDRLRLHIAVLRLCRKGVDINCACRRVLNKYN